MANEENKITNAELAQMFEEVFGFDILACALQHIIRDSKDADGYWNHLRGVCNFLISLETAEEDEVKKAMLARRRAVVSELQTQVRQRKEKLKDS